MMTPHKKAQLMESTRKRVPRVRSFLAAFATRDGSLRGLGRSGPSFALRHGVSSGGGDPRIRVAPDGCKRLPRVVFFPMALALFFVGSILPPALAAEPAPQFSRPGSVANIHATRAEIEEPFTVPESNNLELRTEIATATTGPWTILRSGEATHLTPETTYFVRFGAKNTVGEVTETIKFTTTPPSAPEISELKLNEYPGTLGEGKNLGTSFVGYGTSIQTNGPETEYNFEFATSPEGPWTTFSSGGSGHVSVAEDVATREATATDLTPEKTYYVRVKAKNVNGEAFSEVQSVKTYGTQPEDYMSEIKDVTATSANVGGGFFTRSSETHWRFEYATSKSGPWAEPSGAAGTVSAAETSELGNHTRATITGLSPHTTYYVRLVADNGNGSVISALSSFETLGPPAVTTLAVHSVDGENMRALGAVRAAVQPVNDLQTITVGGGATGGTFTLMFNGETTSPIPLNATEGPVQEALEALPSIGLHNVTVGKGKAGGGGPYFIEFVHAKGGVSVMQMTADASGLTPSGTVTVATDQNGYDYDTHYHFEYVTQKQFEESGFAQADSSPEVDLGAGSEDEAFATNIVGQDLPGLQPGAAYRYRLVATNTTPGDPVVDGGEQTLTVPTLAPEEAPTACPNEALRTGPSAKLPDCRAYEQITPTEKGGAQDIFHYGAALNQPPNIGVDGNHVRLESPGVQWGANPGPKQSNYFFTRAESGWQMTSPSPLGQAGPDYYAPSVFSADLTQIAVEVGWSTSTSIANQSHSLEFDVGAPGGPYARVATIPRSEQSQWVASSADGSKFVLQTQDRTLTGSSTGTTSGNDLYEYANGQLRQVNVLAGGAKISTCGATMAGSNQTSNMLEHGISADGSRVFFIDNCTHHLYLRANGAETQDIGEYVFLKSNPEGSKLLLEKSSAGAHKFFLYDTASASATLLFSTSEEIAAPAASEDMTAIYFASREQLTSESPPASEETEDIYHYDLATKTLHFVVQAATSDSQVPMSVMPNGRYLYLGSDGVAGVPGWQEGYSQEYRYDSKENTIQCIACASPLKLEGATLAKETEASADGKYVFFDTVAALVPQDVDGEVAPETETIGEKVNVHPEHESGEYSVSSDVYEWRRNGVDGCAHIQGCLSLITTGRGGYLNMLFGPPIVSSGRDIFFTTHESLVSQDDDAAGDIYDARIDGGFPPPPPQLLECEGDACSTPFAAPNDLTPSTATFHGAGNVLGTAVPGDGSRRKLPKIGKDCEAKAKTKCKARRKKKARKKTTKSRRRGK